MDPNGMIGEMLETGQATLKNASKQAAADFASSAKSQITGGATGAQNPNSGNQSDHGTNEAGNSAQQQQKTDDQAKQFLKDLYGPTKPKGEVKDPKGNNNSGQSINPVGNALGLPDIHTQEKSPEELAQLAALRNKLHSDYYQNLLNAAKSKDEPVAEKLEREEQQEKFEEIEKQKKKPPSINPTMKQGTAESVVGVSG